MQYYTLTQTLFHSTATVLFCKAREELNIEYEMIQDSPFSISEVRIFCL